MEKAFNASKQKRIVKTIICCVLILLVIYISIVGYNKILTKRYNNFINSFDSVVIYETETDRYIVFPFTIDLLGRCFTLPNGDFLLGTMRYGDENKPIFLHYSTDGELLEELDLLFPDWLAENMSSLKLLSYQNDPLDSNIILSEFEFMDADTGRYQLVMLPLQFNEELGVIELVNLYLPDGTVQTRIGVERYSDFINIDGYIMFTSYTSDNIPYVLLQRNDTVLWSYPAADNNTYDFVANRFSFSFNTDDECFYVEVMDNYTSTILMIDKSGLSQEIPEMPVKSENNTNTTHSRKFEWTYLSNTEFFDDFLREYCFGIKDADVYCQYIGVYRVSK